MADSLNSGIQKLGDTLSAKLFGNSKDSPEGSKNFSGVYIGPGGGITRSDLKGVDGLEGFKVNKEANSLTRLSAFTPIGYFDKTNQWIDDSLKSIIGPKGVGGIERKNSGDGGIKVKDIDYKEIYGEYTLSGWTPPGYFNPLTNLWIDGRLSPKISNSSTSISRTDFTGQPIKAPLKQIGDGKDPDTGNPVALGFTPVAYTRTGKELYLGFGSQANKTNVDQFLNNLTTDGIVTQDEAKAYIKKVGDDGFYESEVSSDYSFKFGLDRDNLLSTKDNLSATPHDNEDPLFLGFEVVIDVLNSPLFNGEAAKFIDNFKANSEIRSRSKILKDTITELSKFFKFNTTKEFTFSEADMNGSIFSTPPGSKRHYVKKVSGLDKLIEANTPSAQSSFVKYRQDLIKLSFYEDTTLNLGTLASLYKLLYWSRINGKNIIPENLLRFDCYIIASEVRNFSRVVKVEGNAAGLETLKENVSRYVYNLYECQFFFDKMTHGDMIDIGGSSLTSPDSLEISFSYKFSTMRFDRFNHNPAIRKYSFLDNAQNNPTEPISKYSNSAQITADGIILEDKKIRNTLNNGYSGKDFNTSYINETRADNLSGSTSSVYTDPTISNLKNDEKIKNYNDSFYKPIVEDEAAKRSGGLYDRSLDTTQDESEIPLNKNGNLLAKAGDKLLQNVKKAALNEAQRQLNNQFRLVNNSLDKVRNTFGIGRMREPTNVYSNPPGGQFFFDVKNSLRDFGGDVLGGLLGG